MKKLSPILLLLFLAGCGSDDTNEIITATIDTIPSVCSERDNRYRTLCPPKFSEDSGNGYGIIGAITNFEYEFGTQYELLLEVIHLENPPADGYGIEFRILEVLREEQDPIGTVYLYEAVPLVDDAFVAIGEGVYALPPYEFLCAENVDCDTLADMASSGGLVSIELTMTGGDIPVTVTNWN